MLDSLTRLSALEARLAARTSHPAATPAGWAPAATESDIADLQGALRVAADERGWPRAVGRSTAAEVDRVWGRVLAEQMDLPPSDAGDGVWSFLAVVVVPDLVRWRFPSGGEDRYLDTHGHAFGRLWARERVLGRRIVEGLGHPPLAEDELDALFRRRDLVADPNLARAIARGVLRGGAPGPRRMELMKVVTLDVLRTMPARCLDVLDDVELDELVEESMSRVPGEGRTSSRES
jgi:hypothetical protein